MSTTTIATLINRIATLKVNGVKHQYLEPPRSIEKGRLPSSFPRLPEIDDEVLTFQANGGLPTLRGDLVVVMEPFAENLTAGNEFSPINFNEAVAMIDNIDAALKTTRPGTLTAGLASWTIKLEQLVINGQLYWCVVANINGRG